MNSGAYERRLPVGRSVRPRVSYKGRATYRAFNEFCREIAQGRCRYPQGGKTLVGERNVDAEIRLFIPNRSAGDRQSSENRARLSGIGNLQNKQAQCVHAVASQDETLYLAKRQGAHQLCDRAAWISRTVAVR